MSGKLPLYRLAFVLILSGSLVTVSLGQSPFKATRQLEFEPIGPVELLWSGGEFTEGPTAAPDGTLLFSDIGERIMQFDPKTKKVSVYRAASGKANGLMHDSRGQLLACEGANSGKRRLSITSTDGTVKTLVDRYEGKRFNSPNDLAIAPNGDVYFTDPRYGGGEPRELDYEGVFVVRENGELVLATKDIQRPNGILISSDGKTAYVADNNNADGGNRHLASFSVAADGTLTDKEILFDFGAERRGIDGMTLDTEGNIYATAGRGDESGIYVFGDGGEPLAFLSTADSPTNCVFGSGSQRSTLYVTAAATKGGRGYALYRMKLKGKGYHIYPFK